MSKLSYKSLLIIFSFLLIVIIVLVKFVLPKQVIKASWWNDSWHYRQAISIENSSGSNLTDFQVSISIGTSALIASGKMQSDCDDIRITDINGNLLPYWIEENNPGCNQVTNTKIWLKANSLPTSSSTIYFYYGNSTANNNENGDNVFLEFDDFNTNTINNWTIESNPYTTYSVSGGTLSAINTSGDYSSAVFGGNYTDVIINSRYKVNSAQSHGGFIFRGQSNAADNSYQWVIREGLNDNRIQRRTGGGQYYLLGGSSGETLPSTLTADSWYPVEVRLSGTQVDTYFNNQLAIDGNFADSTYSSGKMGFLSYDGNEFYDYIFVRKYVSTEPTSTNQSEEAGGGPIAYWKFDEGVGSTAYNSSNSQNNGNITTGTSAPTWTSEDQCISGKCLTMYGTNSYINIGTSLNYLFTDQNFTIESWINPARLNGADVTNYEIFGNESYNNYGILFRLDINGTPGALSFRTSQSGSVQFTSSRRITVANTWYHVAAVRNGSSVRIYINGVDSTASAGNHINPVLSTVSAHISGGQSFNGKMDEVKIYPYARTAAQIKLDYNSRGSFKGTTANLGVQSSTAPDLNSSLIAHYKFDENNGTTTYDSSPNKKTGTFIGNTLPTWSSNCKSKNCINFTATNGTKISTNASYNNSSEYTISAYIYPTSVNADQFRIILGSAMGNNIDSGLVLPPDGSLNICYHNYSGTGDTNYCSTTNPIILNQWQYVALTFNNNQVNVYHNGINVKNADVGKTNTNNYAVIGGSSNYDYSGRRFFNGSIDEVKIYNKALTAEQIKQDYNQGSAISFGSTNQTIGGTTTSLDYCIPGDTSYCAPPVAEWKMDEGIGTSIIDTSGNSNTGTFGAGSSAPTWTKGKIGKGLSFNGTSNFISTNISSVPTTFTMSSWIKLNTLGREQHFIEFNRTQFYVSSSNKLGTSSWSNAAGTTTLTTNRWYYATLTRDSSEVKLYLNGVFEGVGTSGANPTSPFVIGDFYSHSGNYKFSGSIDQVKIYNYARTPAQVAYDYNRGGPVGWWKMDECQGSTIYDWSGNGNNGTLTIGSNGTQNSIGTCQIGTSAAWTNGATGKLNSSLNFDGTDDYININDSNSLDITKAITISAWVKPSSTASIYERIVSKIRTSAYCFGIQSGNKALFTAYIGGSAQVPSVANTTIPNNVYSHLSVTYDGSIIRYYFNGQPDGTATPSPTGDIGTNNSNLTIGSEGSSTLFPGQIDDVRIYNYALTPDQIKQIYNGGAVSFN